MADDFLSTLVAGLVLLLALPALVGARRGEPAAVPFVLVFAVALVAAPAVLHLYFLLVPQKLAQPFAACELHLSDLLLALPLLGAHLAPSAFGS